jgi:hypothetical protein
VRGRATRTQLRLIPHTPLTLRLFDWLPYSPVLVGCGTGLGVFVLFLCVSWLFGAGPGRFDEFAVTDSWGPELILCAMVGLVPAATAYSLRGALDDLESLLPALDGGERGHEQLRRSITTYPRALLSAVGWLSAAGAAAFVLGTPALWADGVRPPLFSAAVLWLTLRNAANISLLLRGLCLELWLARAFSRLGERLVVVDLLDPVPAAPFGRRALRGVLAWMLLTAFYSLLYVGGWAADGLYLVLAVMGGFALCAFLMPLVGAHRRIRDAKQRALAKVRERILQTLPDGLGATTAEANRPADPRLADPRLADLLAWEARLEHTREWPLTGSTLLRFGLYVAIGLGSWVGAAVVERMLERFVS